MQTLLRALCHCHCFYCPFFAYSSHSCWQEQPLPFLFLLCPEQLAWQHGAPYNNIVYGKVITEWAWVLSFCMTTTDILVGNKMDPNISRKNVNKITKNLWRYSFISRLEQNAGNFCPMLILLLVFSGGKFEICNGM